MLLRSPSQVGGKGFMQSKRTQRYSLAQSITQRSMVCKTRFRGTKATVSRSLRRNWRGVGHTVLSSLVLHGEVSLLCCSCLQPLSVSGPGYSSDSVFDLSRMQPYSLKDLIQPFRRLTADVALYLPRTSDLRQLAKVIEDDRKVTIVHYCMKGASKVYVTQDSSTTTISNSKIGDLCLFWSIRAGAGLRFHVECRFVSV